jgi:hypothetical protein
VTPNGYLLLVAAAVIFAIAIGGLCILFDACSEERRSYKLGERDQISGGRSSSGRGDCVVATTASAMPAAADDSLVAR